MEALDEMDEELVKEYIRTVKQERRRRATEKIGKVLKSFGKLIPKGVRSPDSLVTNLHLYKPGIRGKTKLR